MPGQRDFLKRTGSLTIGGTAYDLRLAHWRPSPFRPLYRPVWPERQDVPGGDETLVAGDPQIRLWHITKFSGGEGEDLWDPDGSTYNESTNVRPKPTGEGLVLGAYVEETVDDQGTPATFAQGERLGYGQGKFWACTDTTLHEWQPSSEDWENAGYTTGSGSSNCTSICELDATWMLVGDWGNIVRRVSTSQNLIFAISPTYDPVIGAFGGSIYALSGDDLYLLTDYSEQSWTGEDVDDTVDLAGHGYSDDDSVIVYSLTGGSNLSSNSRYYVTNSAANTFQLATTKGGAAVSFGSDVSAGKVRQIDDISDLTAKADVSGNSNSYLTNNERWTYRRMAMSDVGPVWFQRLDNGATFIHEYNVADDTWSRVGRLPVDFATPYSIFWANGFIFVGFRYASAHGQEGDAYIYYQRSSQTGVAGPFRNLSASTASLPVLIGGIIGDDLIVYHDGAVWAYNLSTGGIYQMAESGSSTHTAITDCRTFGKEVFLGGVNGTGSSNVERFDTEAYSTDTASWKSGRFNMGYAGIDKILLDVTVVHEPLPANTQLTLKVSNEGGTFTSVTGTDDTDDATSYTWTASSASSAIVGRDFELELIPASTTSGSTPTVRSVQARALSGSKQRIWLLEIDVGTHLAGSDGASPRSSDVLADLDTLAQYQGLATFTNPWIGEEWDSPSTHTVRVDQVELVEAEPTDLGDVAVLLLREASYV